MVIRRVNPLSVAKVAGVLYALMGLLIGGMLSLFFMAVGNGANLSDRPGGAFLGMLFGAGAIVVFPIGYGILGAIIAGISALLYNVVAGMIGGVEIDVDVEPPSAAAPIRAPTPGAV
jgi:hypothetical protein